MALKTGTENKRQVAIAVVLFLVVFLVGGWEVKGMLFPSTPRRTNLPSAPVAPLATGAPKPSAARPEGVPVASTPLVTSAAAGPEAQKIAGNEVDTALHFEKMAVSEQVTYQGSGRNIFGLITAPTGIPKPLISARPVKSLIPVAPPRPKAPEAPAIDLKYFGYTMGKDKTIHGYFLRGEEIYAARSGDVVDHRYKIGQLHPGSAEVTDLGYNHTEVLPLSAN